MRVKTVPHHAVTTRLPPGCRRWRARGGAAGVALLIAGCSSTGGSGSSGGSGTTAGSGSDASGAGGSDTVSPGSASSGNAVAASGSSGASGGALATSGSAGPPASSGQDSGGGSSGSVAGSSGSAGSSGGGTGGDAGGGSGMAAGILPAPVSDTASKVPVSNAGAGYTVGANFPYGPHAPQRIDVIYPTGAGPKGTQVLPVVLMFHGGAWFHSYTNNAGSGKDHMTTFFDRFLAHGFMVCNAEYRVNDGTVDGAPAPAAVEDALLAAKWCWDYMDYFHGDRTRYVVTGASAGGHLALMVGMTTPAAMLGPTSPTDFKIAAIVDGYGPADIEAEINAVASLWIPSSLPNRAAIAKQVNPMTYVRKDIPPLIAVTGANDGTAPVGDTRHLVALLSAAGADATIHEVAGAGHGFATPPSAWPDAEMAMFTWLTGKGIGK